MLVADLVVHVQVQGVGGDLGHLVHGRVHGVVRDLSHGPILPIADLLGSRNLGSWERRYSKSDLK